MSVEYGFGIDLGTTNSAVARSNGVEVHAYQNNDQMSVTPSAVHISKRGRLLVGKRAYNAVIEDPDNVATEFKRSMGQKVSKSFPASGRNMLPEELSAEVLKSLKEDVRLQTHEEIQQSVITVPAAFGTLQCEATSRAAKLAGITETYLLQEPIAASVAYGVGPQTWDQYWLVFDLGGGTLDIAVVSTREGRLTILEHQGNNLLGGKDMDRLIVEKAFLPALEREFELPEAPSPERLRLLRRLLMKAEDAKIDLSTRDSVIVTIEGVGLDRFGAPIEAEIEVSRSAFEKEIEPLIRTCVGLVHEALSGARLSASGLDRVLLVGGPTRIPYLRAALTDGVGVKLDSSIDPMTVVARGAAIFAASVDWARAAAPSVSRGGKVNLALAYDKVSSDLQVPVTGRVVPPHAIEEIKIDADGGFWTSGWIQLENDAFVDLPVRLVEGKLTRYWVYARRADGSLVDLEPNELNIRHGLVPGAPPIPHSIGIEVVMPGGKTEFDTVFPKGTSLPAERQVKYRAARELRPSQRNELLAIKVWEGEIKQDPDANLWVGAMSIRGGNLSRPIAAGAEIILTVHIDESRRITVDAELPNGNESLSEEIYMPDREERTPTEEVARLANSIGPLLDRLGTVEAAVSKRDDPAALQELGQLRSDLEDVDLDLGLGELSDDPDFASRLLARVRDIRRRLVALERAAAAGAISVTENENLMARAERTTQITEKFGTDAEKRESAQLKRKLEEALSRDDQRGARKAGEDLDAHGGRVRSNQDKYWKDTFEAQQRSGQRFVNQQEARKWFDAGELAVRKGDSVSLREAVKHLWKLWPQDEKAADEERAKPPGLRQY
jgi:molecular chaperone DnaK